MNTRTTTLRVAALSGMTAVICAMAAPAAVAADGDVEVLNTETVQVYTSPTGEVETQRVYEQLVLTGTGSVDLSNPISTDGLRNLDGFSGFDVRDGNQVTELTVDGEEHLRSVSDFDGELPLDVSVAYTLDGESVEPGDVVGESGKLEVIYTVKNVTGQPQEVSFPDGEGGTVTKTVDVPLPMVGSLSTVAPENFTNVESKQANMAGDGKGGTKMSFTMTLFPPIGSDTATFGYTADIVDGVVPRADVSALPVNPLQSPTFATAAESYGSGADTGSKLADGAATIDSNLLKLRDGAAELLAGLIKLRDGSAELRAGLAGEAAPGAAKLADGTGQASDGAGQLADGAGRLDDGLGQLDGGVGDLSSGADQLAAGQRRLADGLKLLYEGVDALPRSVKAELKQNPDYIKLLGALQGMADAVDDRFLPGLQGIEGSLRAQFGNVDAIAQGLRDGSNSAAQAMLGLSALNGCAAPGTPPPVPTTATPSTECELVSAVYHGYIGRSAQDAPPTGTGVRGAADKLSAITSGLRAGLFDNDDAAFKQLRAGLSSGVDPVTCAVAPQNCGIKEGALFIRNYGIPTLVDKILVNIEQELLANIGRPTPGCDTSETLRCGAEALADGGGDLTAGVDKLVAGVAELSDGGSLLAAGAGDLSDGLGQIDDGANQLADGLGAAADGSGRLTDGLGTASDGAPKLVDGAEKLSVKGTSKLVEAGVDTAQTYGELGAVMVAGAERAEAEDMAYGAPEGALGLTAYSYVIQGEDGESTRNWARGLAGLALLGLGGGAFALRRRVI